MINGRLYRGPAVVLAFLVAGSTARAQPLLSGGMHAVTLSRSYARRLEDQPPGVALYARAIVLDRQRQFVASSRIHLDARRELERRLRRGLGLRTLLWQWLAKARVQAALSERLSYLAGLATPTAAQRYERARALHEKWLAVRAFGVARAAPLADLAARDYVTLKTDAGSLGTLAHLGHAALHAQRGDLAAAHRELRLSTARRSAPAFHQLDDQHWLLASFHAAVQDLERALAHLQTFVRHFVRPSTRVYGQRSPQDTVLLTALGGGWSSADIVASNAFDPLRAHPRFVRLLGH